MVKEIKPLKETELFHMEHINLVKYAHNLGRRITTMYHERNLLSTAHYAELKAERELKNHYRDSTQNLLIKNQELILKLKDAEERLDSSTRMRTHARANELKEGQETTYMLTTMLWEERRNAIDYKELYDRNKSRKAEACITTEGINKLYERQKEILKQELKQEVIK